MKKVPTIIVSFNAHVGLGLKSGGLRWLLNRNPLTSLGTVQEGRFVDQLKRNLGRRFAHYPKSQPGDNGEEAMTYVFWLKLRYKLVRGFNYNIRHGGQYPRKLTAALLQSRRSKKFVLLISLHPDPMGKAWKAPRDVVEAHQAQMGEYLDFIEDMKKEYPGLEVVVAGDSNEVLHADVPQEYRERSAIYGFRRLGLTLIHKGKLDGIWVTGGGSGKAVNVPTHGMDHPATVGRTSI